MFIKPLSRGTFPMSAAAAIRSAAASSSCIIASMHWSISSSSSNRCISCSSNSSSFSIHMYSAKSSPAGSELSSVGGVPMLSASDSYGSL
uniref:Putative secreted peptide n=1 Tax=Anopheles braziliensis TaxID=58242 RepID=A0A2M3ZPZ4_9DIPT